MASRPKSAYRRKILDDFLSCAICFKPYTIPKALPCLHTFCQECLEQQQRASTARLLRCSICREHVTLTFKGVAGLPDNHLVSNLCEEFSKKTQLEEQKNRCGLHPTKEVDLFCQQCEVLICSECIGDGHPGHNITGVKQAAPQIKANIRAQLKKGQQKMETLSTFLKKVQDVQKRLTDNKTQTQQQINRTFEEQVQKLQKERDGLLATVDKTHQDNMTALTGPRDTVLTQLAELARVCEDAEKCLEQEEPVWLSQDLNLEQTLAKFENTETPEICETKLCNFEAKISTSVLELGKVTLQNMPQKELVVQPEGQDRVTSVRPIRVGQPWVRKVSFGGWGSGRGKFRGPYGVAVSHDNEVYIADWLNTRIQVFTMDGVYIREFTTTLPGETGEMLRPCDVAIDRNDNLWVVGEKHVVQYSREGTCLATIDLPCVAAFHGITVAIATEQVIVTEHDGQNGQLRVFNQDGSEVGTYGSGHRSPEPWRPCYVTVDGEGNILVTDDNNHCVHVLDREGNFKFKFGSKGSDESQLNYPRGICVDGKGNIIVADNGNGRVKMFDSQGRFLCHIASGMKEPQAVTVSPGGDVVVTDWKDHTVSVWTQG